MVLSLGTLSCFIGSYLGSVIAFLMGRFIFREKAEGLNKKYPVFRAMEQLMIKDGYKFVFLLRLILFVPFNISNPALGTSAVSLKAFLVGGFGTLPVCLFYCYFGSTLSTLQQALTGDADIDAL